MRLLVVDADTRTVAALADLVDRRVSGTSLDSALSAQSALQKLVGSEYDVILCATGLPDMEHVAFLSAIRAHRPHTPILVLCTQVHEDLLTRAALHRVFHFVPKPIQPEVLIAVLSHLFEQARLQQETGRLGAKAERSAKRAKRAIALSRLKLESRDAVLEHRQEALDQCRAAEGRLTRILNGVPLAIVICDPSWRVTFLNDTAAGRLSATHIAGQPLWEAFPGPAGSAVQQACLKATQEHGDVQVEITMPGKGRRVVTIVPLDGAQGVFMRDFEAAHPDTTVEHGPPPPSSSRRTAPDPRPGPSVPDSLQSTRAAERSRIARDLQEDLGQLLAVLTTDLAWLESRLSSDQLHLVLKVQLMTQVVKRMIETLRRICSELRPAILEDLGLAAAIQWHATTFEHRTGIRCLVTIKDGDGLDPDRATGMFRVFQELLHNVARHAGASLVRVSLTQQDDELILDVKDDGKGIEPGPLNDPSSLGLRRMQERARLLGGHLIIAGVPSEGTAAVLRVPVTVP